MPGGPSKCLYCGEEFADWTDAVNHAQSCTERAKASPLHWVRCESCSGSGKEMPPMGWMPCRACAGSGRVWGS